MIETVTAEKQVLRSVQTSTNRNGVVTVHDTTSLGKSGPSYFVGSDHVRPAKAVKGDGIHAEPYWFKRTELDVNVFHLTTDYTLSKTQYGTKTDIRQIETNDLTGHTVPDLGSASILSKFPSTTVASIDSTAILKAQAKLRKQVASLPMLFAERKATLRTARKYSVFILNNVITMQRKDVKRWAAALKRKARPEQLKTLANQIANSHLEFVFGVLPVIDDITSSIEHFSKPRIDVRTGRGRHRLVSETEFKGSLVNSGPARMRKRGSTFVDYSVRCDLRCAIISHVRNDASLLGFNPVYTWFDMTPLSFILGWFSNFNLWLQSLDPLMGLEYVTGSSSKMTRRSVHQYLDHESSYTVPSMVNGVTLDQKRSGVSSLTYTEFERDVHATMPSLQKIQLVDKTSLFTHAASLSLTIQRLVKTGEREIKLKPFKYKGPKPRNLPPIKYKRVKL